MNRVSLLAATGAFCLVATACTSSGGSGSQSTGRSQPSRHAQTAGANSGGGTRAGCYVQLFDGSKFEDNNFKLRKPGRYTDLKKLPGADKDWTDEADSLKVGSGATVTVWSKTGFTGNSQKLKAGSEHPDLDVEPSSLALSC
jgi:hypothetical protein